MLVVNERTLLIENIGATQELASRTTRMDARITNAEITRRRAVRFCAPALIFFILAALCIAGVFVYSSLESSKKDQHAIAWNFDYPGKWAVDETWILEILPNSAGVSVTINSSTWWYVFSNFIFNILTVFIRASGAMVDLDEKSNPASFRMEVSSASFSAPDIYYFVCYLYFSLFFFLTFSRYMLLMTVLNLCIYPIALLILLPL